MTVEAILLRLYDLLGAVEAKRDPLERAEAAHLAARHLRRMESEACAVRDAAIRQDRRTHPERKVAEVAEVTGIGLPTIINARRTSTIRSKGARP